jgi:hypothetical protein
MMELHAGFCCRGSGVTSGLHWTVGTNENRGEGFAEGRGIRNRKQDYSNLSISVSNHSNHSNHSGLLLLERRKRGGPQAILFLEASLLLLCLFYLLLLCMYSCAHDRVRGI